MSDCFDHCLDAYEDLGCQISEGEFVGFGRGRSRSTSAPYDPLFYHSKVIFDRVYAESEKSYCLIIQGESIWIPKKICRKFNLESKTVYVHSSTYVKILRKHCL